VLEYLVEPEKVLKVLKSRTPKRFCGVSICSALSKNVTLFPKNLAISKPMKPRNQNDPQKSAPQLFQSRLDSQLNLDHPLCQLADRVDWNRFDQAYAPLFCHDNGAPALPTRLMVGLEYLKYAHNLSDEELVARWIENPYWQYFCGEVYFQTELPLHYTSLGKWRLRLGAEKLKLVLEETVRIALKENFVTEKDLSRIIIDTTVQEKNITFPTDAKLLSRAIIKLAKFARLHKIMLRQSYARKAKQTARKASGYAAARQYGRLKRCNQDLKNWLGRILRDIDRKRENTALSANFVTLIETAKKLLLQEKNTPKKVYSLHERDVQCIGKGKDHIRYEFGNKSAVVISNNRNWILNVEDLPDNPYDGHTLASSISGTEKVTKVSVAEANVDRGYRGHDYVGAAVIRLAGSSNSGLSFSERKRKRRRSAIEPVIGHLKSDHRLDRCFLRGRIGDVLNLIGSAVGFNVRKLLRLLGLGIFSHALLAWGNILSFWGHFSELGPRRLCLAGLILSASSRFFVQRRKEKAFF
jgi:IS5 family transposase